jgi:hypothetical protein
VLCFVKNITNKESAMRFGGCQQAVVQWSLVLGILTTTIVLDNRQVKAENITFPADAGHLDVTKAPYNVVPNDGVDDTMTIQAALSDACDQMRIVYFPNGTYNISNTLVWRFRGADGTPGQGNWCPNMSIQGQSEAGVIFKLKDNCPGFQGPVGLWGNWSGGKGVIQTAGIGDESGNTAFGNSLRNFTVDVGVGNPGAFGIDYLGNNQGMVNNITLKAGTNSGAVGMRCTNGSPGPCLLKNITVQGFGTGVAAGYGTQYSVVLEHLRLSGQRDQAFAATGSPVSVRDLQSTNTCPAVTVDRADGSLVLIDSQLKGGASSNSAIAYRSPVVLRNVSCTGYGNLARHYDSGAVLAGPNVSEYVSSPAFSLFPSAARTLNLPIEAAPVYSNEDLSKWVKVGPPLTHNEGGSQIQVAIDQANREGKDTVYIPWMGKSVYRIGTQIRVYGTVRRIIGMGQNFNTQWADLIDKGLPVFVIENINGPDVTLENFNMTHGGQGPVFDQKTTKALVLRSITVWDGKTYRNTTTGGKLFVEDMAASGWTITGPQHVFFRQINCEQDASNSAWDNNTPTYILNNGATVWAFGLKTERELTVITTRNGGKTEVLGGLQYPARPVPSTTPMFLVDNSTATFSYATEAFGADGDYNIQVREIRNGVTKDFGSNLSGMTPRALPRNMGSHVPLFTAGVSANSNGPNLISNPSFDAENYDTQTPSGWSEWSNGNYNTGYTESFGGSASGARHGTHWGSGAYQMYTYQFKTGLSNGLYTARLKARSGGGQISCVFAVKHFGGSDIYVNLPVSSTYQTVEVRNVNVSNGQCEIGIWSDARANQWCYFDDVEFFKQ